MNTVNVPVCSFAGEQCAKTGTKYAKNTVNHFIFTASKFGVFKRLTYWRSLILAVFQFNASLFIKDHRFELCSIVLPNDGFSVGNQSIY